MKVTDVVVFFKQDDDTARRKAAALLKKIRADKKKTLELVPTERLS